MQTAGSQLYESHRPSASAATVPGVVSAPLLLDGGCRQGPLGAATAGATRGWLRTDSSGPTLHNRHSSKWKPPLATMGLSLRGLEAVVFGVVYVVSTTSEVSLIKGLNYESELFMVDAMVQRTRRMIAEIGRPSSTFRYNAHADALLFLNCSLCIAPDIRCPVPESSMAVDGSGVSVGPIQRQQEEKGTPQQQNRARRRRRCWPRVRWREDRWAASASAGQ